MSFWDKLAPAQPAPQSLPAPSAVPSPWWAPTAPPVPAQQASAPVMVQPAQVSPGQYNIVELLGQQEYSTDKAKSSKVNTACPECDSPNYMSPDNIQSPAHFMPQCFNCGYNPRFMHSTQGVTTTQSDAPTRVARGQQGNVNNFNPRTIVDRVT